MKLYDAGYFDARTEAIKILNRYIQDMEKIPAIRTVCIMARDEIIMLSPDLERHKFIQGVPNRRSS
jgi:hypothetical protein